MMNEMMPHWLTKQADLSPHKIAIENSSGQKLTFLQLQQASESFAKKLASLPIKEKDTIAILSSNQLDMIVAVHALTYLKAIAIMLNTRLSRDELHYQLKESGATLVLTTEKLRLEKKLHFPEQRTFEEINGLPEKNILLPTQLNLTDPFTMMFTSGTTGHPKAVIHTYGNHWSSAIGSVLNLGLETEDKWLLTLPIFHVGGLSILLRSVIYGMTVYVMEKYDSKLLHRIILEDDITIASLVTMMLKQLIDELGDDPLPSKLRCVLLGGGSVPAPLLERVKEKNIPLFQSYGMTETSSQIVTLNAHYAFSKLGSAGKPLFSANIRIRNENEEGIGEIIVQGPMVMNGYFNNEAANKSSFIDGWFKTGDLGYLDDDGFLYVVDRRTDLIISGGENIYPSEIESVILRINGVKEVAIVGEQDETWGQVPIAFIVSEAETISIEALDTYVKDRLANFKVPKKYYIVPYLPRNASNKIMRHKLTDWVQ